MPGLRSRQAKEWREGRRLRAWELHKQGWSQAGIAEALGATQGTVSQWIGGKVLVIWDGSPIDRALVVKDFQGLWNCFKYVELNNVCCDTIAELRREMRNAVARLRRKPEFIKACTREPGFICD